MDIAKPHLDVGLYTQQWPMSRAFWEQQAGLVYDHMGKLGGGVQQHRFHANGSIIKVNHARDPLPAVAPGGIAGVRVAREGLTTPVPLADPDGNRLTLVPPGADGVVGIAIDLVVRNRDAHDHFWRHVMQFDHLGAGVYGLGDTLLCIVGEADVAQPVVMKGPGWRYLTVQIRDCRHEHAGVLTRGGTEGAPPRELGDTVRFSMVQDPDGNWIELSQRASLVGALHPG
jgi:lactoylglutathione lyase